ncbi:MAG: M43 family zinc metalloprotease [Bacteroidota bacterium]
MHKIYTSLVLFIITCTAFSQNDLKHCGADEMRISTLKQNPEIAKAVIKRDEQLEEFTKNFINAQNHSQGKSPSTATYIIPVVFHVIHNYGPENISDAQLKDGIDIVNKTFNKTHPNTSSIIAAFQSIHVNCDVEFRLATKDPNGNCHSGINRIASPLTSSGDHRIKSLIHWPPTKYLNVYVVANAAGLAGHAVWPSDADTIPLWDGIVLSHNYVGTIGTSNLTQSVAFAHECGHFLNLHHIWGGNNVPGFYYYPCADPNKDCSIDDLVADTPPTIGWQGCNLSGASCGNTVDNVQNAMDYSYCNIMFTQGQKTRMQACLNSAIAGRNNLWQTANLVATGVYTTSALCAADFVSDKKVICPGNQVVYSNTSYQGTVSSYSWKFQGGSPATSTASAPAVSYAAPGSYSVELTVSDGTTTLTTSKQNYISVQTTTGSVYPYTEGFETTVNLNGSEWLTNNLDTSNSWQITNSASSNGSKSIMINNYSSAVKGKDELYSKTINLAGATSLNISFKYAFARRDTSNKDRLQVFCIQGCNGTAISRFSMIGSALETVPLKTTAFYPASSADWQMTSANILPYFYTNGFRLKFVFSGDGGNNIFIDDINISVDAGIKDISEDLQLVTVFPNPTSGNCSVSFNLVKPKNLSVKITDVLGKEVYALKNELYDVGEQRIHLNTGSLQTGLYFIQLSDGLRQITKQLVISK